MMKKISLLFIAMLLCAGCTEQVKETMAQEQQQYGNSTENTALSPVRIDNYPTYQIYFTLEKPTDCLTIEIESVYLQKSFPVQKIPARTFFIVEKKLKLPAFSGKDDMHFTQLGRNFNHDWEVYSPVKICSSANDPLSKLDQSDYRIRFTTFDKSVSWYVITITCKSKVIFNETVAPLKK